MVQTKHIKTGRTTVKCMDLKNKLIQLKNLNMIIVIVTHYIRTLNRYWPSVIDSNQLPDPDQLNSPKLDCYCLTNLYLLLHKLNPNLLNGLNQSLVFVFFHLVAKKKLFQIYVKKSSYLMIMKLPF